MRGHNKITAWESRSRIHQLEDFLGLIVKYADLFRSGFRGEMPNLREGRKDPGYELRTKLNQKIHAIHEIIRASGVSPVVSLTEPRMLGGRTKPFDLLNNLFDLAKYNIQYRSVIDLVEQAIGIYRNHASIAKLRTFNPLFWLGLFLDYVASLPIRLLGKFGFDQDRLARSRKGQIIKAGTWIGLLIGIVWKTLDILEKLKLFPFQKD